MAMPTAALLAAGLLQMRGFLWLFHPDMTTFAAITLVGVSCVLLARWTGWTSTLLLGLFCGLTCCVREHGLIVAGPAILLIGVCSKGSVVKRISRMGLGAAAIELTSRVVIGQWLMLAGVFDQHRPALLHKARVPWNDTLALFGHNRGTPPSWMVANVHQGEGAELLPTIFENTYLAIKPFGWGLVLTVIGLALLAKARRWRTLLAVLVPISPLPALFLLWAEPRHILSMTGVFVGIGVGGLLATVEPILHRWRAYAPLAVLGLVAVFAVSAKSRVVLQDDACYRDSCRGRITNLDADAVQAARWIRQHSDPNEDFLKSPHLSLNVEAHLVEAPGIRVRFLNEIPDVSWRTWVLTDAPMFSAWEKQYEAGRWSVYQLERPPNIPENCLVGRMTSWGTLESGPTLVPQEDCVRPDRPK